MKGFGVGLVLSASLVLGACGDDGITEQTERTASSISLSVSSLTFTALGDTQPVTAVVLDQRGDVLPNAVVSWSVDPAGVASVTASGTVTATAVGSATLTATSGAAMATAAISVEQLAASVSVAPALDSVLVTGTLQLSAGATDLNGNDIPGADFSWTSSDQGVASVSPSGLVTGEGVGEADITVEIDGRTDTATVVVEELTPPTLQGFATSASVGLLWDESDQRNFFASFEVRRGTLPGVTTESTLVYETDSPIIVREVDTQVESGLTYYYRVFEHSSDGVSAGSNEVEVTIGRAVELGAIGFDLAVDTLRDLVYVSLPILNEVAVVSQTTFEVVDRILVGSRPHGIDLSHDLSTLYVALNGASSVVALDLETQATAEIVVGDSLGHSSAYDVAEGAPDRVFVSANPGSSGFAWIVMIETDTGNTYRRVASNRIIRASPVFEKSPDAAALYIGEGFSPNSLYRLDLTDPEAPIVLEDDHGSVSGTRNMSINPDGSRIYLGSGQVLRTGSFLQSGVIGSGVPEVGADGTSVYVSTCARQADVGPFPEFCALETYDTGTLLLVDSAPTVEPAATRMEVDSDGRIWALSADFLLRWVP